MSEVSFARAFLAQLDRKPIKLAADYVSDPRTYPSQSPFTLPRQSHPFTKSATHTSATQPSQNTTLTITLKPTRAGASDTIVLQNISASDTSIYDLKTQYASKAGFEGQLDKIKVLYNKKPAADLKTLQELGVQGKEDGAVEFGVMIMGSVVGTPRSTTPRIATPPPPAATAGGGGGGGGVSTSAKALEGEKMEVDIEEAPAAAVASGAPDSERAQMELDQKPIANQTKAAGILDTDEFWSDLQGFLAQRLRDEAESQRLVGLFRRVAIA